MSSVVGNDKTVVHFHARHMESYIFHKFLLNLSLHRIFHGSSFSFSLLLLVKFVKL